MPQHKPGKSSSERALARLRLDARLQPLRENQNATAVQLDTLKRAAAALDCELVYALVPRQPLEKAVELQRGKLARELNAKVRTHRALEGQDATDADLEVWRRDRAESAISAMAGAPGSLSTCIWSNAARAHSPGERGCGAKHSD